MIRGTITEKMGKEKSIEICKWLLSFNEREKTHTIKCYQSDVPDVRFCFDRGNDCMPGKKIMTIFLTIKKDLNLWGYVKDDTVSQGWKYDVIKPDDSKNLPLETLKYRILEYYCFRLKKFSLNSPFCSNNNIIPLSVPTTHTKIEKFYLPVKADAELALSLLEKKLVKISKASVLDQIAKNCEEMGKILKEDWRYITEQNLELWYPSKDRRM